MLKLFELPRQVFMESARILANRPKLLCPLPSTPIIICVGLNYRKHAEEASVQFPNLSPDSSEQYKS